MMNEEWEVQNTYLTIISNWVFLIDYLSFIYTWTHVLINKLKINHQ